MGPEDSSYSRNMKRAAWLAIAGVVGLIVAINLHLVPGVVTLTKRIPGRDTTTHFLVFGGLSLIVNLAFARSRFRGRELGVSGCTGLLLVAIALEEFSQKWIPLRDFTFTDMGASFAGALVFALLAWILLAREASRRATA